MSASAIDYRRHTRLAAEHAAELGVLLEAGVALGFFSVRFTIGILQSFFIERRAIRRIRMAMKNCAESCRSGECLREFHETAIELRDSYGSLLEKLDRITGKRGSNLVVARKCIETMLFDWDDIVEDCVIASDPEFRAAVSRIAKLC